MAKKKIEFYATVRVNALLDVRLKAQTFEDALKEVNDMNAGEVLDNFSGISDYEPKEVAQVSALHIWQ